MKRSLLIMLLISSFSVTFSQTTPAFKTRTDGSFTQGDSYLSVIKRLGIPTSATDDLDASIAGANTAKLLYNTTTNKLRVFNPVTGLWKDAIEVASAVNSVNGHTGDVWLNKYDVDLSNVDNSSDANKNVFSASKLTTARAINGTFFDGTDDITVTDVTKLPLLGGTVTGLVNYDTDKSANYTTRSLVDREFVYKSIMPIVDKKFIYTTDYKQSKISSIDTTLISVNSDMSYALSELTPNALSSTFFNKTTIQGEVEYFPATSWSEGRNSVPDSVVIEIGLYKPTSSGFFFKKWGEASNFSFIPIYRHKLTGDTKRIIEMDASSLISFFQNGSGANHQPMYSFTVPLAIYKDNVRTGTITTQYQSTNSAGLYEASNAPIRMGYCLVVKYYFADATDSLSGNANTYVNPISGTLLGMQRVM